MGLRELWGMETSCNLIVEMVLHDWVHLSEFINYTPQSGKFYFNIAGYKIVAIFDTETYKDEK